MAFARLRRPALSSFAAVLLGTCAPRAALGRPADLPELGLQGVAVLLSNCVPEQGPFERVGEQPLRPVDRYGAACSDGDLHAEVTLFYIPISHYVRLDPSPSEWPTHVDRAGKVRRALLVTQIRTPTSRLTVTDIGADGPDKVVGWRRAVGYFGLETRPGECLDLYERALRALPRWKPIDPAGLERHFAREREYLRLSAFWAAFYDHQASLGQDLHAMLERLRDCPLRHPTPTPTPSPDGATR